MTPYCIPIIVNNNNQDCITSHQITVINSDTWGFKKMLTQRIVSRNKKHSEGVLSVVVR